MEDDVKSQDDIDFEDIPDTFVDDKTGKVHIFIYTQNIGFLILLYIRVQQRNGKKRITTITGLATDLNLLKLLKAFKKNFQTNGSVVEDERHGKVIKLFGDQRNNVKQFLLDEEIIEDDNIIVHGG